MSLEPLAPDAIVTQTNLSGALAAIQDDPESPDASWWTAPDGAANTEAAVGFPTPSAAPTTGAGLQSHLAWVRKSSAGGTDPDATVRVRETGGATLAETTATVTSTSGALVTLTWDATLLSTADGSAVECVVFGTRSGGSPANRRTIEVGAVRWKAEVGAASQDAIVAAGVASLGLTASPGSPTAGAATTGGTVALGLASLAGSASGGGAASAPAPAALTLSSGAGSAAAGAVPAAGTLALPLTGWAGIVTAGGGGGGGAAKKKRSRKTLAIYLLWR